MNIRTVTHIAKREIRSSLVTPLAYIIMASFLVLSGFLFFSLLEKYNGFVRQAAMQPQLNPSLNQWVVMPYYQMIELIIVFTVPLFSMRALAEEHQNGTFELLATSPISSTDIIWGKFFGITVITLGTLLLSLIYPVVLMALCDPEVLPVLVGFMGLMLFATSYCALGIAVSSATKSQTIAGIVSLVLMLVIYVIDAPAGHFQGAGVSVLEYLAPSTHTAIFSKGVITGHGITYFASITALGLFCAGRLLKINSI